MDHFTHLPDANAFAKAFREGTLLCVFESLALKGPEGEFKENGLLYGNGDSASLEYVSIVSNRAKCPGKLRPFGNADQGLRGKTARIL